MRAYPASAIMLDAVVHYLRSEALRATGGDFNMRVSINILELVARELRQQDDAEAREHQRLISLLGEGELDELRNSFCAGIADGSFEVTDAKVLEHLRSTALDRLAIDQPRYSAYRRAIERRAAAED